ncbi:MAG TPA: hypothetical protein VGH19_21130 [Verrucomicrobiae bacterium]
MRIKLLCNCGTKFTFDVEPVDGRMPTLALCPKCQVDCTEVADAYIAQVLAARAGSVPPVVAAAPPPSIKLSVSTHAPAAPPPPSSSAPAPTPEAPVKSSGLKVSKSAHTPPPPPSASLVTSQSAAPSAPTTAGLSVTRKASEPAKPEAGPTPISPAKPGDTPAEEDSFEARRAKRLAEAHGKQAASHAEWGKTLKVIRIAAVLLIAFAGFWGWYSFVGSAPALYYEVPSRAGSYGMAARLFSPEELVVADGKSVAMHDLKTGQIRWTLDAKKETGEDEDRWGFGGSSSYLHVTDKDIWAVQGGKLQQIDPVSGKANKEIPVNGSISEFTAEDKNLVVISQKRTQLHMMVVNLATGETKTETIGSPPKEKVVAQVKGKMDRPPTSGNLLKQELEGDDEFGIFSKNTLFAGAGDHAVRVDVKITKTNVTRVQVMRDAPKKSKLNANTSIMSNPGAIAEDVFNDIKRSEGGQFESVDLSTYQVTVNRILKSGGEGTWEGEVSGEPAFYSGKTVDLIVGHQEIIILSKANKVIARRGLNFPTGAMGGLAFRRRENPPFLETADTLYFWDKGTITAFDLPSGNKRWDFQNVGITSVVADDDGGLYVCGTTAKPESIQFSEDINIEDRPRAQFFKLDARTGKKDWEGKEGAKDVYLTGKFLYTTRPAGSTLGLMGGDDSAGRTYIHRVNPRNGKIEWELEHKGDVDELTVFLNRLAITSGDNVQVYKFLSL